MSRKSSSVIALVPFHFSNAVVTPSPSLGCPENVPSYISPHPHDGLIDFTMNWLTLDSLARFRASCAPVTNPRVASFPFLFFAYCYQPSIEGLIIGGSSAFLSPQYLVLPKDKDSGKMLPC